jgi:hypothetical protein
VAFDLDAIVQQYESLRDLADTDPQASANGAAMTYAATMPHLINEIIRLSALVGSGYEMMVDVDAELTHELKEINRRDAVAGWLEALRSAD